MYPNAFLKSLWRNETLDQVFVAMSFESRFDARFEEIIRPAIESEPINNIRLSAYRVDNSKTGDSILTDIVDGIAHSRLVLADASVIDEGRYAQIPVRNGNVMYEIGIALACRNPSEVLLIRDDDKKFLFDVSTIPHKYVDFSNAQNAIRDLRDAIEDRLRESTLLHDARIKIMARSLTNDEIRILKNLAQLDPGLAQDFSIKVIGGLSMPDARGIDGLLQKACVQSQAINNQSGALYYSLTPFGFALAEAVEELLPKVEPDGGDVDEDNKA